MLRSAGVLITLVALAPLGAGCTVLVEDQLHAHGDVDAGQDANVPDTGPIGETCTTDAQCVTFDPFNCHRVCVAGHCSSTGDTPDGTACGTSANMHCVHQACVMKACGDGFVDRTAVPPEYCDDGNTNPDDGCNNSCTRSCVAPAPANCDDHITCNGTEMCTAGLCAATGPATPGTTCMVDASTSGTCMMGRCVAP